MGATGQPVPDVRPVDSWLEERVALITGKQPGSFEARLLAVTELLEDRSHAESLEHVLGMIQERLPGEASPRERSLRFRLRLEAMESVQKRRPLKESVGQAYLAVAQGTDFSNKEREYALRNLGLWGEALNRESVAWGESQLGEIEGALVAMTEEPIGSLAGTALLSLHRMVGGSKRELVAVRAGQMAQNLNLNAESRAAALHLLASKDPKQALAVAQDTLGRTTEVVEQLAAIAAVGQLAESMDDLEGIADSASGPVAKATLAAASQIAGRISVNKEDGE